jgi:hypothetical protein
MFEIFMQIFGVIGNNVFVFGVDFRNLAKTNSKNQKKPCKFCDFWGFFPNF